MKTEEKAIRSCLSQKMVADTVDNSNGSGNARAYKDGTVVSRSGVIGYNYYSIYEVDEF